MTKDSIYYGQIFTTKVFETVERLELLSSSEWGVPKFWFHLSFNNLTILWLKITGRTSV